MEDLFKQFRENLERRPEPAFESRDWHDLQARLERDGLKRPPAFAWWWMTVPFILLLTGSNAFFFMQWKKAAQKVSSLEIRHDTVFHTRVIYTSDTVYRTRVLRERVVEYQNGQRGKSFSDIHSGKSDNIDLTNMPLKGQTISVQQPIVQNTAPLYISGINCVVYRHKPLNLTHCEVLIPAKKYKKSLSDHLYTARPKGYQLGVSGGLAYPFGNGLDFKSGYSAGLHTAVKFSPSLRLWADAAYYKTLFLTDRMGDDIGVPIEGPPSNEYLFLQAEVPQPFLQYSAGMQYLFRSQHRLKPFVGIGLGAISLLPYDVIYEFENTTLNVEWDLDRPVQRQGLITNFLVLPVGLEYGFSNQWIGQIQANYRYNWKGTGLQSPNMLGIQGGLNYRF